MSNQVTIQPNFKISSLLKLKQRDTSLDNFQLYKSGRYALFFGLKKNNRNKFFIKRYIYPHICLSTSINAN